MKSAPPWTTGLSTMNWSGFLAKVDALIEDWLKVMFKSPEPVVAPTFRLPKVELVTFR